MSRSINASRLFNASCFALITTAFSFSIRAGILAELGNEYGFSAEQLGTINSMWFVGFLISMFIGGSTYNCIGGRKIMQLAFVDRAVGIPVTLYAGRHYFSLVVSTLLVGLGNGWSEAARNPLIADAYQG